jgi:magnesium chelatase family protein
VRKAGSGFDLAIAAAVLAAAGVVPADATAGLTFLGELGLNAAVRPVTGVLPAVMCAVRSGWPHVVVAAGNLAEARLVPDVRACGVASLRELIDLLKDADPSRWQAHLTVPASRPVERDEIDMLQVVGQTPARYALEVAAAGGHHLLMVGPPGCGKTMLAERLPTLLPDLERGAALEVTAIHSVAGALPHDQPLIARPPWRAPHHSATLAALIGGGSGVVRPGAISQAHRGVLFLDEAPEFSPHVLDALRQPLESGVVEIARANVHARFPARFMLMMAANPCPCGQPLLGDNPCQCTTVARRRYLARLSGPLLDRMDLRVTMDPLTRADLLEPSAARESSARIAARVCQARARQARRYAGTPWSLNAHVPGSVLRQRWPLTRQAMQEATRSVSGSTATGRGLDKVLRLAWTVADLNGVDQPGVAEVDVANHVRDADD